MSLLVNSGLNYVDDRYRLTEKISLAFENLSEEFSKTANYPYDWRQRQFNYMAKEFMNKTGIAPWAPF